MYIPTFTFYLPAKIHRKRKKKKRKFTTKSSSLSDWKIKWFISCLEAGIKSQSHIFIWFNIYQFDSWFDNFLFLYILLSWNFKFNFMKYEIKIQFVPMYFRFLFKWNNNFFAYFLDFFAYFTLPFFYVLTIDLRPQWMNWSIANR